MYAFSYFNRDSEKALPLFYQAARQGNTEALQELYFRSDKTANKWERYKDTCGFGAFGEKELKAEVEKLLREGSSGSPETDYKLGWLYYRLKSYGTDYERNLHTALKYWRQAAGKGHSGAQLCLGAHYFDIWDRNAEREAESEKWLTMAAEHG